MAKITPVILCGGAGTRLWPSSTDERPKPFLPLIDGVSTFAATLARVADSSLFCAPIVVANQAHFDLLGDAMGGLGLGGLELGGVGAIILETEGRDSAPAIAAALNLALARDPASICLVLAADHLIRDQAGFRSNLLKALPAAQAGRIVVFGIPPSGPSTGFGYIRPGPGDQNLVRKVAAFVEKPDRSTALRYCAEGYLWNAGMFMMRARDGLAELARLAPELGAATAEAIAKATGKGNAVHLHESFLESPKISFDYAVMEKTDLASVVTAEFDWSDIGSWSVLWEISPKDSFGNVVVGPALLEDVRNCYVRSDGTPVALAGVADLVVVAEAGKILVVSREKPDLVKTLALRAKADQKKAEGKKRG